jgi:hypothetical protein
VILVKADLLSVNEYLLYKDNISSIETPWWLKTAYSKHGNYVHVINNEGAIGYRFCSNKFTGVRPFCTFSLEPSDSLFWCNPEALVSSEFQMGGYYWTVLEYQSGDVYALCNDVVICRRFDKHTNEWSDSDLRDWVSNEFKSNIQHEGK